MSNRSYGIYLHIPFCLKKCDYCDFCSFTEKSESEMLAYAEALCLEMRAFSARMRGRVADTLFFGGGTPTLLPDGAWEMLASCLRECFDIAPDAEWTAEANPATVDAKKARLLRRLGVNRISIGMQSAQDGELARLGRIHRASDLPVAVQAAREGGFDNISLDLMFGIPGQTAESLSASLDAALALSPSHLSVYSLQIEEGTPFYRQRTALPLPDEESEDAMHTVLLDRLKAAGFVHYEISNFALPGRECRHNLRYWQRGDYLGFGIAAHAFLDGVRSYNTESLEEYMKAPTEVRETESVPDIREAEYEAIMLGLRLGSGINEKDFLREFGHGFHERYGEALAPIVCANLAQWDGQFTRLTETGMRLSNAVLTELFNSPAASLLFP